MAIKHKKRSTRPNNNDPGDVQPEDWNDEHTADGLVGAFISLGIRAGAVPFIGDDGNADLADLTVPGRAVVGSSTFAAMLAVIGAVARNGDTMAGPLAMGGNQLTGLPAPANATDAATKAYVDALAAAVSGALVFKGGWDASAGSFPGAGAAAIGWFYKVDTAGTVGGMSFSVGDDIYAVANNASAGVYAGNWIKVEGSITRSEIEAAIGFALGTAASKDVGTAPGNVVQLDGSSKLPAVDGSQLTNIGGVRYDTAQAISAAQRAQARDNIDAAALAKPNVFTDTTEATGAGTTAAAIISGGLEVLKKLFVTGAAIFKSTISVQDTTDATSSTAGSVQVAGGLAVAKKIYAGNTVKTDQSFETVGLTRSWPQLTARNQSLITVPQGNNAVVAPIHTYGKLIISSVGNGSSSEWLLAYETALLCNATNPAWVASTATPPAGKFSVFFAPGFGFVLYNNVGQAVDFRTVLIETNRDA